jgi:hypothetical protein
MRVPVNLIPFATAAPGPLVASGPITREMVHARTRLLAVRAGRHSLQISQADYEQARRELTGETDMARQEAVLDAPAKAAVAAQAAWENEGGHLIAPAPRG